jgi:prepilin-type processing-associated H-X9-DG protein
LGKTPLLQQAEGHAVAKSGDKLGGAAHLAKPCLKADLSNLVLDRNWTACQGLTRARPGRQPLRTPGCDRSDDVSGDYAGNFNHVPGGGNVLYMDGHVEFIKYPGEAPFISGTNRARFFH